jgi:tRNA (guanine37-N1)-methyltransferase
VPDVLLNGDHAKIRAWRRRESLKATLRFRPDLLEGAPLDERDLKMLKELKEECSCES